MSTSPDAARPARRRTILAILFATLCGAGVALQSRINGQLGSDLSDGYLAAVVSFASGLVIISVVLAFSRGGREGFRRVRSAVRSRIIPPWFLLGGLAGGLFVLSQGITVSLIGIALFTVAAVAGQTLSGLIIDAVGIGTVARKRVTPARVIGSAVALVAVAVSVAPEVQGHAPLWALAMPLVVGLLLGWQQAVNGQVKTIAASATSATFVNFVGGTALLLIIAAIDLIAVGPPARFPTNPLLYTGGVVGVIFIAGFAFIVPIIGVLLQSLAAVSGQLLMALLLDFVAPTAVGAVAVTTIVGTLLALVGVVIAAVPRRSPRESASA
jgi:transporter family-2 protein